MKTEGKPHTGGIVTGRYSYRNPEFQELRPPRGPVVSVMVTVDFSKLEERVMAQLESKGQIAEAMRKALVSRTK